MPLIYNKALPGNWVNCKLVDRTTPYGNPFTIGKAGDRDMVCDRFEDWIERPEQMALVEQAKRELRGFNLVCWCWPNRCHAETWIRIVNDVD